MKSTLVVVADLSRYKAYRVDAGNHHNHPRLELLEHYDSPEAHGKLVDKVSDMSGQFPRGTTAGAMSDGERHNIELESRKRLVRQLAQRLNSLARNDDYERCFLAASREINNLLVGELDPKVRAKIQKNVPSDLTKIEKSELLAYF
jgi:hypothetical protein